jgi:SAM-dependent methyltransferase
MTDYNAAFYDSQADESLRSARIVLPLLFAWYQPKSVIDIGCGAGTWLHGCQELGVEDFLGIDGDYVPAAKLLIPPERFVAADIAQRLPVERSFDLAVSLEVAEHLPLEAAEGFAAEVTRLSDLVLFSAAIPYQGGTGHVNEHWPEFWARAFAQQGYEVRDLLRPLVWTNPDVCVWYRQNLLLFARSGSAAAGALPASSGAPPLSVVHPELYLYACERGHPARVDCAIDVPIYRTWAARASGEVAPAQQVRYGPQFQVTYKLPARAWRALNKFWRRTLRWLTMG